ncbi:hypothetical protein GTY75_05255 [Streptomyces sp. SID8381]|uniref:hypothetical protein n=1 Tax=unclassified Streptomyces TaxID=2593676 RepID=UPI0003710678|nr:MULTISPECIES: hypothetical protein [unclassified Streptomyces]MYX26081.1 hypothetical protein [Streptomyces sp. SID8381]
MRIPFFSNWIERRAVRDMALAELLHADTHMHEKVNELLKLSRRRELLVVASQHLAEKLNDKEMAEELSEHFCLDQLSSVVNLLRAAGYHQAAQWWADSNSDYLSAAADEDEDEDQEPAEAEPVERDYACPHGCGFEASAANYVDIHLDLAHRNEGQDDADHALYLETGNPYITNA